MIDPQILRQSPEVVRSSLEARGVDSSIVDLALEADSLRREAIKRYESLRADQNLVSKKVGLSEGDEKKDLLAGVKDLSARVKVAAAEVTEAEERASSLLGSLPNLVSESVPVGGEENFAVLKEVGDIPSFQSEPRDHLSLGENLNIIDMERGAKVSGSRFYFLRGAGAQLENALMQLGLQLAIDNDFIPIIPPTLVRPETMQGTGFLGEHSDEVYFLQSDQLYLTGTSEVGLAGFHRDEILELNQTPLRYIGLSTCYRREAGSHGKDTRGIIRVHQFQKLEMFSYVEPLEANDELAKILDFQEKMIGALGIPYRVIDVAAGDLGMSAARKFDIEAWIPSQSNYRELTSASNCTTFQARRLNIRYRQKNGGGTEPVATLNGTLATTRWLAAILEIHQQVDGSVRVPEALQPYMGGVAVLRPPSSESD